MGVSRATFGRIVQNARSIVADALINGKAINVGGGNYIIVNEERRFSCKKCQHTWVEPAGTGKPEDCPSCHDENVFRMPLNKTSL